MQRLNIDESYIEECGNVVGIIRGSKPGKCLLMDGHIDTVVADAKDWVQFISEPFLPSYTHQSNQYEDLLYSSYFHVKSRNSKKELRLTHNAKSNRATLC
jgi:acetylornithine deacetylase/succinyl-diaminopimelate desuccinylase-like protein